MLPNLKSKLNRAEVKQVTSKFLNASALSTSSAVRKVLFECRMHFMDSCTIQIKQANLPFKKFLRKIKIEKKKRAKSNYQIP